MNQPGFHFSVPSAASWHRPMKRVTTAEPIPSFFDTTDASPEKSIVYAHGVGVVGIEEKKLPFITRHQKILSAPPSNLSDFSPEFIAAISGSPEHALPPSLQSGLKSKKISYKQDPSHCEADMKKFSLISLVLSLLMVGGLFFLVGFLVAVRTLQKENTPATQQQPSSSFIIPSVIGTAAQNTTVGQRLKHASEEGLKEKNQIEKTIDHINHETQQTEKTQKAPPGGKTPTEKNKPQAQEGQPQVTSGRTPPSKGSDLSPKSLQPGSSPIKPVAVIDISTMIRPYTLQAGVFPNKESANRVVSILRKRGYRAYMTVTTTPNQGYAYAVRLGGYFTRQAAERVAKYLVQKEKFKILSVMKNLSERVIL